MACSFMPDAYAASVYAIDLKALWQMGKRCLVLDLDNTLLPYNARDYGPELTAWLDEARRIGFSLFILSNGHHVRVEKMANRLGVECLGSAGKPAPKAFAQLQARTGCPAEACVAVGDQFLTDICGANRAGLYTVFVERIDNNELFFTRLSRVLELPMLMRVRRKWRRK